MFQNDTEKDDKEERQTDPAFCECEGLHGEGVYPEESGAQEGKEMTYETCPEVLQAEEEMPLWKKAAIVGGVLLFGVLAYRYVKSRRR